MSGIFDLDRAGQQALDEQARIHTVDGTKPLPPTGFAGFGQASKSLMDASASAGRTLLTAAGAGPVLWDAAHGLVSGEPQYGAEDWWFKHAVDNVGQDAVDYWKPDASQMGSASKVLSNVLGLVGSIPQMIGTPEVFLANAAFAPATNLVQQGVGAGTALASGGVSLAVNAAGFKLPAAIGNTLATRIASGVGVNEALGVASDAANKAILASGGYDKLADQHGITSFKARGLDALMGAVFGGVGHVHAMAEQSAALDAIGRKLQDDAAARSAAADAVLTRLNGEHFGAMSMPGMPTSLGAIGRGQKALSKAIGQILNGDPVDVAGMIRPGDFIQQGAVDPAGYAAYRRALESDGNPNAENPNSSAVGIDQFTDATWLHIVGKEKPAWAKGLTREQLLAERLDPVKSGQMAQALDAENATILRANGVPIDDHTLYAAHHFGPHVAVKFAKAGMDTPVADVLPQADIDANPYLKGKTKAEVLANWDERARAAADAMLARDETNKGTPNRGEEEAPGQTTASHSQDYATVGGTVPEPAWLDSTVARGNDGQPAVLYRGSRNGGTSAADFEQLGAASGHPTAHLGVFLTDSRGDASHYGTVGEYHVDLRNPKHYDIADLPDIDSAKDARALRQKLIDEGHDGIVLDATPYGGPKQYVVFKPEQLIRRSENGEIRQPTSGARERAPEADVDTSRTTTPEATENAAQAHTEPRESNAPRGTRTTRAAANPAEQAVMQRVAQSSHTAAAAPTAHAGAPIGAREPEGLGNTFDHQVDDAAAQITAENPDMPILLDDGTTITASGALAEADRLISQSEQDARGFAAAALCAARYGDAI